MLTQEQLTIINRLRTLSKNAKKGPWHKGGTVNKKTGKTVYVLGPAEEDLIIEMRNNIEWLLESITENETVSAQVR